MRGQAFIVFEDIESAKKAKEAMSGIELFGKPMVFKYLFWIYKNIILIHYINIIFLYISIYLLF